ncbi:type 1 glutamine amidotransferase domain-containing protein [Chengkuizengella axinellae]|uniref:Type 1 glutamine amidotransferase domain-containing protein n=1 Tax=Chengkuizengella axinellae TaxID=3064388 RepID=A0ABT9IVC6_9BACL|nr:type 1 glutamine amidotransferase domain-containing protein [Chengkuizengella sp. 2205SS18-9]MDP5273316.1 type 1 glutamine amidotransferase domain-containing protein [Chengkuizengella sp. 2205SS18-9]
MNLQGKKVLAFVEKEFEDLELWYPVLRMREAGLQVDLVGPKANETYIGKYGVPITTEKAFDEVDSKDYIGLYVTGGWAPDKLRRYEDVLRLTREIHQSEKPIAHICHGGWVLVSAKICEGFTMTSTPGIKDDLENAGATWIDQEVVVDRHIVSGRRPPDLPNFTKEFIRVLSEK